MYKMTLTRDQEIALIEIGIRSVLERAMTNVPEPPASRLAPRVKRTKAAKARRKTKRRWTDAQRVKFRATMKKLWAERKKGVA